MRPYEIISDSVISWQGYREDGFAGFRHMLTLNLWPESLSAASSWFGVVVFGFGVAPFVFNFRYVARGRRGKGKNVIARANFIFTSRIYIVFVFERKRDSMANPRHINLSLLIGLLMVYAGYIAISNGIRVLFSPSYVFRGDVLQAMPGAWLSSVVRLLMTFVISVTAPLIVIPCGEMIEGKLGIGMVDDNGQRQSSTSTRRRVFVRVPFCLACMVLSELVPDGFVHLLSFIGCFCVATTSFVLPSLFCLQLSRRTSADGVFLCDAVALAVGVVATCVTSSLTFRELIGRVVIE